MEAKEEMKAMEKIKCRYSIDTALGSRFYSSKFQVPQKLTNEKS